MVGQAAELVAQHPEHHRAVHPVLLCCSSSLDSVGDSGSVDTSKAENVGPYHFCRMTRRFPPREFQRGEIAGPRDRGDMNAECRLDGAALETLARPLRVAVDD